VNASRITKIAGLSLVGFVAASIAADKFDVGPIASQAAGFAGAFMGTLFGRLRAKGKDQLRATVEPGSTKTP
jgi:uncharacterized membrane protein YeaQ/YmgE (transglycosylase-associated protein family)